MYMFIPNDHCRMNALKCETLGTCVAECAYAYQCDIALDKCVKGTCTFQSLFKELSRPISCFKCSQCGKITDSITCFEHACTSHPNLLEDLSCKDFISALGEGNPDSIFDMCSKMSNCHSLWNVDFSA